MHSKLVLVLNCGSSSVKFSVIDMHTQAELLRGGATNIGNADAVLRFQFHEDQTVCDLDESTTYNQILESIVDWIHDHELVSQSLLAVGHRVVHGGELFTGSQILNPEIIAKLEEISYLAPLHNPANMQGIAAAMMALEGVPHVAVFDTAFHQTMPQKAYLYALPYRLYREHGIRRYGFHGTSHAYVSKEAASLLGMPLSDTKLIVAHLGNGASVCAVDGGKSVDTSMGMTPLEGLVMGTRCGDIDPSIPGFLVNHLGYTAEEVNSLFNRESGLLGLTGYTNDFQKLDLDSSKGKPEAIRGIEIFSYRLAKYIASYTSSLGRLDALVFTGGIGENSSHLREMTLSQLQIFGFELDKKANEITRFGEAGIISCNHGPKAMVIPTNEELMIAKETARLSGIV